VKRRVIATLVALVLAGTGAVLLLGYVGHADSRAMAGMRIVNVLVVTAPIAEGTTGESLGRLVTSKALPVTAVANGALSSVASLTGQVATTDLQPGEQLLASRFVDPATLAKANELQIPPGMQQLTISLPLQRALGGFIAPGMTVGMFLSLAAEGTAPPETHLMLHRLLVTKVEGGKTAPPTQADKAAATPADTVLVTVAVNAHDAERVVYGAEHGTLWLSLEPADAVTTGTRVVTRWNVNK
jgi:pilus assembly protein CpaB